VFVADGHGSVHALARNNGALEWSQQVDLHPEAHLWSSPIHLPDVDAVVVGVASFEEVVVKPELTFRGSLVALAAADGRERWRLETTDADAGDGPGIAIWSTVAVDRVRGALYIGTGNNYAPPASGLSDALLAVDYEQGGLLWRRQLLPGDVFSLLHPEGPDYDIGATANVFSAGGRDLVGIGSKSGADVALERDSGEVAWTAQITGGGFFGGIISPAAYADGTLFVLSNDPETGTAAAVALAAGDGREIWRHELKGQSFSGVAHANGVVFAGDLARKITALDAATGTVLWSDELPDIAGGVTVAAGMLLVSFGYPISVGEAAVGAGGLLAYRLP
jgi:polyvinyl alcohol dehydrogenase (cytochrome)